MLKITHIYRFGLLQKALFCLGLFLAIGTTGAFAQFAVTEDFRGSGNPDIIIGDQATLTSGNVDPVNQGWLRLTTAETYKKGHAYINKSFPSTLGVLVDFEYKVWRNVNDGFNGADGIGVFLFDGTVTQSQFTLGAYGGSLGYVGLRGGYVGIGIDEFGNFANPLDGGKHGGPAGNGVEAVRPNSIVLRGPTTTNNTDNVVGGIQPSNRYLSGKTIRATTSGTPAVTTFSYRDIVNDPPGVATENAIDYNTRVDARPSDATYYRRIQIEIKRLTTGGEYEIIVRWKTNPASGIAFTEITRYTTTDVPPGLLKLGFGSATGGGVNFHEIRNLLTTTPNNMRVIKRANKDWLRGVRNVNPNTNTTDNQVQYTIEITNDTDMQADQVKFEDYLTDVNGNAVPFVTSATANPGGFYIESIVPSGFLGNPTSASFTRDNTAGKISHNNLSIAANGIAYVTVTGRLTAVPTGNLLRNSVTVTPMYDTDMNNNTSVVDIPVLAEGTDVTAVNIVDHTCSDGSNVFTIRAASVGTGDLVVGTNNNSNRLRMAITLPASGGFSIGSYNFNGWDVISQSTNNGLVTYTLQSNQSQTITSGNSYSYPIIFTINKTTPYTAYSTTAVASYLNSGGGNIESSGNTTNNTSIANVYAIPLAPAVSNVYYCQGATPLQLTAARNPNNASTSGYALKWYFSESGGFSSDFAPTPSTEAGGIQSFWVSQVNGTCEGPRARIDVYVSPTPTPGTISGNQNICSGSTPGKISNVTAGSVGTATGMTLVRTYKWQFSDDNGNNWTTINNATSNEYTPPATITATRQYKRITVSTLTTNNENKVCESSDSNIITVTVSTPTPGVIAADQVVCYNMAPSTITVSTASTSPVANATLSYVWEYLPSTATNWSTLTGPGTSGETYSPPALTTTTRYRRYTVSNSTVSGNSRTCTSSASNIVTIEVQGQINPGTLTAASNQTICANSRPNPLTNATDASITNALPTSGLVYRWESATNTNGPWATIANGTTNGASYTFPTSGNGSTVAVTTYYRRVAVFTRSSDGKACQEPTAYVTVTVGLPPAGSISADQIICKNSQPAKLTSASGGAGSAAGTLSYQWYSSNDAVNNFNPISGATEEGYQPGSLGGTTYFLRTTKSTNNGVTCESARTNAVKITVVEFPNPGQITNTDKYACYNTAPTEITSSTAGSATDGAVISYRWQQTTDAANTVWSGDIPNATSANYTPGPLTQTTSFRRFTIATYPNAECRSTSPTNTVKVNVSVVPTSGTIKNDQVVCSGTTPNNILNDQQGTGSSGLTYLWQSSTDGVNWINLSTANPDYQPQGGINQTTYYRRFGISKNGTAECYATEPSNTVTVTVPVTNGGAIASAQTICYGTAPQLLTSATGGAGTGTNITYKWQAYPSNGSAWADISNATNETYQPGTLTVTTRYRRVTTSTVTKGPANCSTGTSNEITITVSTQVSAGSVGSNQIICYNTVPATLQPSGSTSTTNYRWDSSPSGNANTWTPTGVTTADFKFTAPLTQTTYYRRATISGSCEAYATPVVITVMSRVEEGSISGDQNICMDTAPARIGPGTQGSGQGDITYKWESLVEGSTNWTVIANASEASYLPPVIHKTTRYRRTTISTSVINGFTSKCESASTTGTVVVTVRNCKVITNPMIYQKVKN